MKIISTEEFYGMDSDRLLVQPFKECYTTEEMLLFGEGAAVIFYDDVEEMEKEKEERKGKTVLNVLETINKRIAVIMKELP